MSTSTSSTIMKQFEEQAATTLFQLVSGILTKVGKAAWDKIRVQTALRRYADGYCLRHGQVKVLGMSQPISLNNIYTAVRVVTPDFLGQMSTVTSMELAFRNSGRQQQPYRQEHERDGFSIANSCQLLNVLGAPGSGKSTFLRRLGYEAMLASPHWDDSFSTSIPCNYFHSRIPVLIELRRFRNEPIDLMMAICNEFDTCGFPECKSFVETALTHGRMLILLDGLDEVPDSRLTALITHCEQFVDRWGKEEAGNRFVTSCRTARYKNYFRRFTDTVIADFCDSQIRWFASRWFSSDDDIRAGTSERFCTLLIHPDQAPTLELARTPLLLTFLCLTYGYCQELPSVRAMLYRRALDILLREWAAERRVHQERVYADLSVDLELDMLAEMAADLFRHDRFFFRRDDATGYIRKFMNKQLKAPKSLDADLILHAIEVQQGLIVQRASDVYSFSHLTIQEYLTARELFDRGPTARKSVIVRELFNQRWSVVFELLAGLGNSDELLALMASTCKEKLAALCKCCDFVSAVISWIQQCVQQSDMDSSTPYLLLAQVRTLLWTTAITRHIESFLDIDCYDDKELWIGQRAVIGIEAIRPLLQPLRCGIELARGLAPDDVDIRIMNDLLDQAQTCIDRMGGAVEKLLDDISWTELEAISESTIYPVIDFDDDSQPSPASFYARQQSKSAIEWTQNSWLTIREIDEMLTETLTRMNVTIVPLRIVPEPGESVYGEIDDYIYGLDIMVRSKSAAYRVSEITWAKVCRSLWRPLRRRESGKEAKQQK